MKPVRLGDRMIYHSTPTHEPCASMVASILEDSDEGHKYVNLMVISGTGTTFARVNVRLFECMRLKDVPDDVGEHFCVEYGHYLTSH